MPTSSPVSISRLLKQNRMESMASALSIALPVSARKLIDQASFNLLSGWELVTTEAIAVDQQNNACWQSLLQGRRELLANCDRGSFDHLTHAGTRHESNRSSQGVRGSHRKGVAATKGRARLDPDFDCVAVIETKLASLNKRIAASWDERTFVRLQAGISKEKCIWHRLR